MVNPAEKNGTTRQQTFSIPEDQPIQANAPASFASVRPPNVAIAPSPPSQGNAHYMGPPGFRHQIAPNHPVYVPHSGAILMVPPSAVQPRGGGAGFERASPSSTQPSSNPPKAKATAQKRRKLTTDESLTILYYWRDHYELFAKSNKKAFAKKAAEELNRDYFAKQANNTPITGDRIQKLLGYWTKRYKEVVKKFHDSGHGLKEDDPTTLKESAEKSLKHFWELHSFLATKANINPPVLLQPRQNDGGTHLDIDREYGQLDKPTNAAGNELSSEEESEDSLLLEVEAALGEGSQQPAAATQNPKKRGATGSTAGSGKRKRLSAPSGSKSKRRSLEKPRRSSGKTGLEGETSKAAADSQGKSERTAGNSASRLQMVNEMYATQQTHNHTQTANLGKMVKSLENESLFRQQEVTNMEKSTQLKALESKFLRREQERRDKEEMRKEREEKRKEDEAARDKVVLKRKLVMDEAEQLRKRAAMFQTLNMSGKAIDCMNKAERLVESLHSISYVEASGEAESNTQKGVDNVTDSITEEGVGNILDCDFEGAVDNALG